LVKRAGVQQALETDLPEGVGIQIRDTGDSRFYFLLNFTDTRQRVPIGPTCLTDVESGIAYEGEIVLKPRAVLVAKTG